MKKMVILVDLDGICADMVGALIDAYNTYEAEGGQEVDVSTCENYRLEDWTPLGKDLWKFVNTPGFYRSLPELPGAVDALGRLKAAGHDITILSSPGDNPRAATEKLLWVQDHMPFLSYRDIILTPKKHICRGDIFIDDDPNKVVAMRESWPSTKIFGIEWPYNRKAKGFDLLAPSWNDTEAAWRSILRAVEDLAHV